MLPAFDASGNLPPGIHEATWPEAVARLGFNPYRRRLLEQVRPALGAFGAAGCRALYLAGSFVGRKACPGDIDVLWDPFGVSARCLAAYDPLLGSGHPRVRRVQQRRYGAEFIPVNTPRAGLSLLELFQTVKETDAPRGIVRLDPRELAHAHGGRPYAGEAARRHHESI